MFTSTNTRLAEEGLYTHKVEDSGQVTLTPGQTFYEGPDDVHIVGRNASDTKPAKFVVFLIKDKGAPVLVPGTRFPLLTCQWMPLALAPTALGPPTFSNRAV